MEEFDPSKPALLHDGLNDEVIPWIVEEYAHRWKQMAEPHDESVILWNEVLLDGWCEPLGG
jgi:hypothetical protein